jgi:hypothetical protein
VAEREWQNQRHADGCRDARQGAGHDAPGEISLNPSLNPSLTPINLFMLLLNFIKTS